MSSKGLRRLRTVESDVPVLVRFSPDDEQQDSDEDVFSPGEKPPEPTVYNPASSLDIPSLKDISPESVQRVDLFSVLGSLEDSQSV